MPSLAENLEIIRTNIYGENVRAAIADAIEQSDAEIDTRIDTIRGDIEDRDLFVTTEKIAGTSDDYRLNVTNAS